MKQVSQMGIIFLTVSLLLFHSLTSARPLPPLQGNQIVKANDQITQSLPSINVEDEEDLVNLMGMEECDEKDEDCIKRRMVAEAHLDYIYTQHHKPKGSSAP
ncbi:putative phytosulfokines 6 [Rhododendron vialii]|uniref:putative phytosulfokines 6 n=1 Tax=Rhododendron vialii TaxID=182163 RepID=UPI00265DCF42|nr:putative phytosulfokines 6 [Rhododendron vialii]